MQKGTPEKAKQEKTRILIVDDDVDILSSLKDILMSEGYQVDTAETAQSALGKAESKYFNLALLDIKLPDMEGTELLAKIHRKKPEMMKIMVTGYPSLDNAVKALNRGADAYIIKPIDPKELLRIVREKIGEQKDAESMTEDKVAEWVEKRIHRLNSNG